MDQDKILPMMRTDVILDYAGSGRRIVIDTKFNSLSTVGWYREETLRSGYIYQMYAYLRSQVGRGEFLVGERRTPARRHCLHPKAVLSNSKANWPVCVP
jgi:5-methylcytosine-specific restriction endonuclease McrBC regulatory subunit McrC